MTATLPERPPKRRKKRSRLHSITEHESRSAKKIWQHGVMRRTESFQSEEQISIERPIARHCRLNMELGAYCVTELNTSIKDASLQNVNFNWLSKIHVKLSPDQLTPDLPSISLSKVLEKTRAMEISALKKRQIEDQKGALDRLLKGIVSETRNRLIASIRRTVAEYQKKAKEIRDASLNKSDDSKSFALFLSDLEEGLESPTLAAVDAVLQIQCLPIPEVLHRETLFALVEFIKKHRGTNSQKILIAVGAAIRKVLLNLPSSDVEIAVDLIKSEGSLAVPIGVELEVAKMVVQRVVEDPSINALQFPELADAMLGNARLYSTAKMVNREFYNATALNSVLACLLMQHADSQSLCTEVVKCSPSWFSRLCSNRLKRIRTELMAKNDSNTQELVKHLTSLTLLADGDQKSLGGTGL